MADKKKPVRTNLTVGLDKNVKQALQAFAKEHMFSTSRLAEKLIVNFLRKNNLIKRN
jgi:predicted transcriptional regulator